MATIDRRGATVSAADPPIGTNPNPDLAIKAPVRVATTGNNITLSGLQTIDGVALAANDRVLVKDQTDATTNGLYNATTGPWTRTIDANNNSQWTTGTQASVVAGTVNAQTTWKLTTAIPVILGASALTFALTALVTINTGSFPPLNIINNVKDPAIGAKGDGVTDDYLKIKAADAALALAGGGTLFFPPGTYFTSVALQPSSGVNYQGAGRDVTIIKGGGVGLSPFNASLVIAATFTGGNNQNNLSGTAITYPINAPTEGTNTITTTTAANAGNFAAGQFVLISGDLHGTNFWYPDWFTTVVSANAGTGVITLSENLPFGGAIITTVQRLLAVPQNIKIFDMTILGTNVSAFQITACQNVTVDNIALRAGFGGVAAAAALWSACRNSAFQNSVGYGVVVDMLGCFDCRMVNNVLNGGQPSFDGGSQNSLASGNVINDPSSGGSPSHGFLIGSLANRLRILGNSIINVPAGFAGINLFNNDGGNHIIEGNMITGVDTTTTLGIAINNSVNNTMVGNWLNNLKNGIFLVNGSIGNTVEANTLVSVTTPYTIDSTSAIREPFTVGLWPALTAASATPSVKNGHTFLLANGSAQNVTNFTDGITGQQIVITFLDHNTTLVAGTLHLSAGVNYNPPTNTTMQFVNQLGAWYELSRVTTN